MTTADRLSARTVHTNPEHEDPHKDPKRTETSTVRGKPGRQRARRRHASCFPRPAARYQQRTVLKIQGASRSRAFGCRGFTSVCRSSASVLSPATTRHVCPVCSPHTAMLACVPPRLAQPHPQLCLSHPQPLLWLPQSHLGPQSHLRSQHRLCEPQRYMSVCFNIRSQPCLCCAGQALASGTCTCVRYSEKSAR